jgi:hypothetical protein
MAEAGGSFRSDIVTPAKARESGNRRVSPPAFSAVPAKAGTQSYALRSSALKLLDARFRGQSETSEMASLREKGAAVGV